MKKRVVYMAYAVGLMSLLLTGCCLSHEWQDATCTDPQTCAKCGKTQGEALGHSWQDATCTEPKTCSVCGETEGEPLGHDWQDATCTVPKTCSVCGETEGEALGHSWQSATCQVPKTCSVCGATEGTTAAHKWLAATCQTPKTCSVCGIQEGGLGAHRTGTPATYWNAAICSVCGAPFGDPLVPAFEQNGISINALSGQTYNYLTGSEAGNATTGKAFFDQCSTVDRGNSYSLVSGEITIKFADNEARRRGSQVSYGISDYYRGEKVNYRKEALGDGTVYYFSVDYNGTVYSDCYGTIRLSYERPRITANVVGPELWWTVKYEFYIPTGYDGCVICLIDARQKSVQLSDEMLRFRVN